jgi:hypothetical protein
MKARETKRETKQAISADHHNSVAGQAFSNTENPTRHAVVLGSLKVPARCPKLPTPKGYNMPQPTRSFLQSSTHHQHQSRRRNAAQLLCCKILVEYCPQRSLFHTQPQNRTEKKKKKKKKKKIPNLHATNL